MRDYQEEKKVNDMAWGIVIIISSVTFVMWLLRVSGIWWQ